MIALTLGLFAAWWFVLGVHTAIVARRVSVSVKAASVAALVMVTVGALLLSSAPPAAATVTVLAARSAAAGFFTDAATPETWQGRWNIALLGGDADVDRDGQRIDSITVLSVDVDTGASLLISLPRGLQQIPLTDDSPLRSIWRSGVYDCGHACQLGFLYPYGEESWAELYAGEIPPGSSAGVEALRDGLEGLLELPVHGSVVIDYPGLAAVVDALGGVVVDVRERLPIGGDENQVGVAGWIEPGEQRLSGVEAAWFARSRMSTSEADRMERQQVLLTELLTQVNPAELALHTGTIADAVRSDLPTGMLPVLLRAADEVGSHGLEMLSFGDIDLEHPDVAAIRASVGDALGE